MFSNALFFRFTEKCQKKEREVSMKRLHLMGIGCLMKDSSYGCKSQKTNKAICKLSNYAVIDTAVMGFSALVSHAKRAKHQGKVKAFKPISEVFYKTSTSATILSASSINLLVASSGSSSTNQNNNSSIN